MGDTLSVDDDARAPDDADTAGRSDSNSTTITVNRPRTDVFAQWRDLANLSSFMENVISIDVIDDRRSRWTVAAPGGDTVEWTSVITTLRENEEIAWESEEGADVPNSGSVVFRDAPGGRGTFVTATISYDPPAGFIGKVIAKMFQREPAIQARRDLKRFKQLMETGEIATSARNLKEREERETA